MQRYVISIDVGGTFTYYCPGCAAQLSVTIAHAGEAALSEYEIRA